MDTINLDENSEQKYYLEYLCFQPKTSQILSIIFVLLCLINIIAIIYLLLASRKKHFEIVTPDPNEKEIQSYCIFTLLMVRSV